MTVDETSTEYELVSAALRDAMRRAALLRTAIPDPAGRRLLRVPDAFWKDVCDAAEHFVQLARAGGDYPEQMLVRVKTLLNDAVPGLERDAFGAQ